MIKKCKHAIEWNVYHGILIETLDRILKREFPIEIIYKALQELISEGKFRCELSQYGMIYRPIFGRSKEGNTN